MSKHIHIWLPGATRDSGFNESDHPRADNGKFGKGSGGGGSKEKPAGNPNKAKAMAAARAGQKADAEAKANGYKDLEKHPMYAKADFDYLKGKGYEPAEIKAIWDRDHKAGKSPEKVNKNSPKQQEHFHLLRAAMAPTKK